MWTFFRRLGTLAVVAAALLYLANNIQGALTLVNAVSSLWQTDQTPAAAPVVTQTTASIDPAGRGSALAPSVEDCAQKLERWKAHPPEGNAIFVQSPDGRSCAWETGSTMEAARFKAWQNCGRTCATVAEIEAAAPPIVVTNTAKDSLQTGRDPTLPDTDILAFLDSPYSNCRDRFLNWKRLPLDGKYGAFAAAGGGGGACGWSSGKDSRAAAEAAVMNGCTSCRVLARRDAKGVKLEPLTAPARAVVTHDPQAEALSYCQKSLAGWKKYENVSYGAFAMTPDGKICSWTSFRSNQTDAAAEAVQHCNEKYDAQRTTSARSLCRVVAER
jgi:hypothetical protein